MLTQEHVSELQKSLLWPLEVKQHLHPSYSVVLALPVTLTRLQSFTAPATAEWTSLVYTDMSVAVSATRLKAPCEQKPGLLVTSVSLGLNRP